VWTVHRNESPLPARSRRESGSSPARKQQSRSPERLSRDEKIAAFGPAATDLAIWVALPTLAIALLPMFLGGWRYLIGRLVFVAVGIVLLNSQICRSITCADVFWLAAAPIYLPFVAYPLIASFLMHRITELPDSDFVRARTQA